MPSATSLVEYLNKKAPLAKEEKEFLQKALPTKTYKKGEYLLKEGTVSDTFFFNLNGFVRLFYNTDGVENTAYFYTEGQFISAYESYVHQIPATQNFQAVEDTTVVEINKQHAEELLTFSPKFGMLAMTAMEEELITCQTIIASLLTQTPEERYKRLLNDHHDYFQRIPQHYIASFIGVKPESLSRIKKRYTESKK